MPSQYFTLLYSIEYKCESKKIVNNELCRMMISTLTKKQKWHSMIIFEFFSFRILFLYHLAHEKVLITEIINILENRNMRLRISFKYSKLFLADI